MNLFSRAIAWFTSGPEAAEDMAAALEQDLLAYTVRSGFLHGPTAYASRAMVPDLLAAGWVKRL